MNKCPFAVCRAKWYFPRRSFCSSTGTQLITPVFYNKATFLIWRAALGPLQCPFTLVITGCGVEREPSPSVQLCRVKTPSNFT